MKKKTISAVMTLTMIMAMSTMASADLRVSTSAKQENQGLKHALRHLKKQQELKWKQNLWM